MAANAQTQIDDYSFWITKAEAAKVLKVSTKSVEKFRADGKLHAVSWRRPSGGPKIMVYHPGDVEALRAERVYTPPTAVVMRSEDISEIPANSSQDFAKVNPSQAVELFLRALLDAAGSQKALTPSRKQPKPEVPLQCRVFLTVREAVAYTGVPERRLREFIASGVVPTASVKGYTRVVRADLDKLR